MIRTKRVRLYLSQYESIFVNAAVRQTACANFFIEKIKEHESTNLKLLNGYYREARQKFALSGELTQIAMFRAIRLVRGTKGKRLLAPNFKKNILVLRLAKVVGSTIHIGFGDRKLLPIPYIGDELLPSTKLKESPIRKIKGKWYLSASYEIKAPKCKNYKYCMGVDLGIAKTAVISDWNGNNTKFFRGEPYRFKKTHYKVLRDSLKPKLKQGNVYKLLKGISQKESNWVKNENHKISRQIVDIAIKNKRTIVLEKLTGITERLNVNKKTRNMLKGWSFRQLADFIKYKAEESGIRVIEVDPRRTSKTCPKCQYYSRNNRRTQSVFKCRECGYESNADRVGAMNIALRGSTEFSA